MDNLPPCLSELLKCRFDARALFFSTMYIYLCVPPPCGRVYVGLVPMYFGRLPDAAKPFGIFRARSLVRLSTPQTFPFSIFEKRSPEGFLFVRDAFPGGWWPFCDPLSVILH